MHAGAPNIITCAVPAQIKRMEGIVDDVPPHGEAAEAHGDVVERAGVVRAREDADDASEDEDEGAGACAGTKKAKKGVSVEKKWAIVTQLCTRRTGWGFIDVSNAAKSFFESTVKVKCTLCEKTISCISNVYNFDSHVASTAHEENEAKANKTAKKTFVQTMLKPTTEADARALEEAAQALRVVTHSQLIARAPPAAIAKILGPGEMRTQLRLIGKAGLNVAGESTMREDGIKGGALMNTQLAAVVMGKFGAITADGASRKFGQAESKKPMLLMFNCTELPKPVALALLYPDKTTGAFPADVAAKAIVAALARFGIHDVTKVITAFVGDNVSFNDKLARELGVQRLKCLPHALALLIKAFTAKLPLATVLSLKTGSVIFAGGSGKRAAELEARELLPSKMRGYANRFYDVLEVCKYNLANFEAIRDWTRESGLLEVDGSDDEGDDEDSPEAVLRTVKDAWENPHAQIVLHATVDAIGDLVQLTKVSGGEGNSVPQDLAEQFATLETKLEILATDEGASAHVQMTCTALGMLSKPAVNRAVKDVAPLIHAAAVAALASYRKHIDVALDRLLHRFRFDPRAQPQPLPDTVVAYKEFFGCLQEHLGSNLVAQYSQYIAHWKTLPRKTYELDGKQHEVVDVEPMGVFWRSKMTTWPQLATICRYWAEFPTSSIACERCFGIMRTMEVPVRNSMKDDTFERELLFKQNGWVLEKLAAERTKALQKLLGEQ